ncbi:unnamed protein product [Closterium sp. NIES-65]|nr:unnamed protein product [Closterium sp. NIES-65]CAI5998787.1 unnamed protein product [Closterium sp. NIES-65]
MQRCGGQNELAILEFIHCIVETMDRYFGNVVSHTALHCMLTPLHPLLVERHLSPPCFLCRFCSSRGLLSSALPRLTRICSASGSMFHVVPSPSSDVTSCLSFEVAQNRHKFDVVVSNTRVPVLMPNLCCSAIAIIMFPCELDIMFHLSLPLPLCPMAVGAGHNCELDIMFHLSLPLPLCPMACELDIMFHLEKAYFMLDEMVMNGCVMDTNKLNVLAPIHLMDKSS